MAEDFNLEKRLGAFPSPWDNRNYRVPLAKMTDVDKLPEEYLELIQYLFTPLNDQGNVGSCVGHDGDTTFSTLHFKKEGITVDFSAGWLYWRSRYWANIFDPNIEGSTNLGLMKAMYNDGIAKEETVKTDTKSPFEITVPDSAWDEANNHKIASYHFVNRNPLDMKSAMYGLIDGFESAPLISAYPVYESFKQSYDDGIVPFPSSGERFLGGHSSCLIGWKKINDKEYWVNANSWGKIGGTENIRGTSTRGFFYLPIDYPFYDVELIKLGEQEPEPKPKSLMCQLLEGLMNLFGCECGR